MSRFPRVGARLAAAVLIVLSGAVAAGPATAAPAQTLRPDAAPPSITALPTPRAFVSNLDLECFRTPAYTPPAQPITTQHLNPVLANLPTETHILGARTQLCVPVMKNNVTPPQGVLDFVRWVDLSCYAITGQTVNFPLTLRHLNPVLANQPAKNTAIAAPEQLCLPVIKNDVAPPAEVFNLVRYIDLKCYRVLNTTPLGVPLNLRQLNPVLGAIQPATVQVREARQLCVPVRKNGQAIPADVLNVVRWVDLEKYDTIGPALASPFALQIRHVNPLLTAWPAEQLAIQARTHLMLPVQKNTALPPG